MSSIRDSAHFCILIVYKIKKLAQFRVLLLGHSLPLILILIFFENKDGVFSSCFYAYFRLGLPRKVRIGPRRVRIGPRRISALRRV